LFSPFSIGVVAGAVVSVAGADSVTLAFGAGDLLGFGLDAALGADFFAAFLGAAFFAAFLGADFFAAFFATFFAAFLATFFAAFLADFFAAFFAAFLAGFFADFFAFFAIAIMWFISQKLKNKISISI
jgi:hypothetical protein